MADGAYTLLDFGDGERLEQWGEFRLIRPDPTAQGRRAAPTLWPTADATYEGEKGKGRWLTRRQLPDHWPVAFDDLRLAARLAPYKHTGIFPEQVENWRWMRTRSRNVTQPRIPSADFRAPAFVPESPAQTPAPLNVLNLFAYTGAATVALARDGHRVTHVDAAKPSIAWAKENAALNDIPHDRTRWILDDAPKFVARERRRGKAYDAIVLDPPAFGHSPTGKTWRVERDLEPLLQDCAVILSPSRAFVVLNGYARQDTPEKIRRLLARALPNAQIEAQELTLQSADGRKLSTGVVARARFS